MESLYTHMVMQTITTINTFTKKKWSQEVEVYWGTQKECEEYVAKNKGKHRITTISIPDHYDY